MFQHADLLPPGHSQIPQIHQQPAEDAAPDGKFLISHGQTKSAVFIFNTEIGL